MMRQNLATTTETDRRRQKINNFHKNTLEDKLHLKVAQCDFH